MHVCNQGAYTDNSAYAVDRLLMYGQVDLKCDYLKSHSIKFFFPVIVVTIPDVLVTFLITKLRLPSLDATAYHQEPSHIMVPDVTLCWLE